MGIPITQARYDELKKVLTPEELAGFSVITPKTFTCHLAHLPVGTEYIEDISDIDVGTEKYIYESHNSGYTVPVKFKTLDDAKAFCFGLFGDY